jgi:hypothetical protein
LTHTYIPTYTVHYILTSPTILTTVGILSRCAAVVKGIGDRERHVKVVGRKKLNGGKSENIFIPVRGPVFHTNR